MDSVFNSVAVGYIIFLNAFWLAVKGVLRSNGFPTSLFWHSHDFTYLNQLVSKEVDPQRKSRFKWLRISFYGAIGFLPILLLLLDVFLP